MAARAKAAVRALAAGAAPTAVRVEALRACMVNCEADLLQELVGAGLTRALLHLQESNLGTSKDHTGQAGILFEILWAAGSATCELDPANVGRVWGADGTALGDLAKAAVRLASAMAIAARTTGDEDALGLARELPLAALQVVHAARSVVEAQPGVLRGLLNPEPSQGSPLRSLLACAAESGDAPLQRAAVDLVHKLTRLARRTSPETCTQARHWLARACDVPGLKSESVKAQLERLAEARKAPEFFAACFTLVEAINADRVDGAGHVPCVSVHVEDSSGARVVLCTRDTDPYLRLDLNRTGYSTLLGSRHLVSLPFATTRCISVIAAPGGRCVVALSLNPQAQDAVAATSPEAASFLAQPRPTAMLRLVLVPPVATCESVLEAFKAVVGEPGLGPSIPRGNQAGVQRFSMCCKPIRANATSAPRSTCETLKNLPRATKTPRAKSGLAPQANDKAATTQPVRDVAEAQNRRAGYTTPEPARNRSPEKASSKSPETARIPSPPSARHTQLALKVATTPVSRGEAHSALPLRPAITAGSLLGKTVRELERLARTQAPTVYTQFFTRTDTTMWNEAGSRPRWSKAKLVEAIVAASSQPVKPKAQRGLYAEPPVASIDEDAAPATEKTPMAAKKGRATLPVTPGNGERSAGAKVVEEHPLTPIATSEQPGPDAGEEFPADDTQPLDSAHALAHVGVELIPHAVSALIGKLQAQHERFARTVLDQASRAAQSAQEARDTAQAQAASQSAVLLQHKLDVEQALQKALEENRLSATRAHAASTAESKAALELVERLAKSQEALEERLARSQVALEARLSSDPPKAAAPAPVPASRESHVTDRVADEEASHTNGFAHASSPSALLPPSRSRSSGALPHCTSADPLLDTGGGAAPARAGPQVARAILDQAAARFGARAKQAAQELVEARAEVVAARKRARDCLATWTTERSVAEASKRQRVAMSELQSLVAELDTRKRNLSVLLLEHDGLAAERVERLASEAVREAQRRLSKSNQAAESWIQDAVKAAGRALEKASRSGKQAVAVIKSRKAATSQSMSKLRTLLATSLSA